MSKKMTKRIGPRLVALRLMAGVTASELCKIAGFRRPEYLAMEANQVDVSDKVLETLGMIYDVPPDYILQGPLPVPTHLGKPMSVESDVALNYLEVLQLIEKIDRVRQTLRERWPDMLKELALPRIPLPFPRASVDIIGETAIWFDLPHVVSVSSRSTVDVSRTDKKPLTIYPKQKVLLKPGLATFFPTDAKKPGRIRVTPYTADIMVNHDY